MPRNSEPNEKIQITSLQHRARADSLHVQSVRPCEAECTPGRTSIEAKIHMEAFDETKHVSKQHRRCLGERTDKVDA